MELITRHLVVGAAIPAAPPGISVQGVPEITFERLNHIFGEVASSFGYRNFQSAPDGSAGQILGATPTDVVVVQPGLLQVQDPIELTPERSAEKAQRVLQIAAKHLKVAQLLQLGVKWVSHAPVRSRDAKEFLLENVFGRSEGDLGALSLGGQTWAGMKLVTPNAAGNVAYTLVVEPLQVDMSKLFIEVDANFSVFSSPNPLDEVEARASEVLEYVRGPVQNYLERLGA